MKISDLPLRDKHPELRAAIAAVVGHEDFIFLVFAKEPDGTLMRMSNSEETLEVLRRLAVTAPR